MKKSIFMILTLGVLSTIFLGCAKNDAWDTMRFISDQMLMMEQIKK